MNMNRTPMSKKRIAAALAAVVLVALAAVPVSEAQTAAAGPSRKERREAPRTKAPRAVAQRNVSGLQAVVDPVTGQLRQPTAEESMRLSEALEEMLSQSSEGLEVVELGDGTMMVDLQDRFQEIAVASIVGGQIRMACVNDHSSLDAFLKGLRAPVSLPPAPVPQPLEEK